MNNLYNLLDMVTVAKAIDSHAFSNFLLTLECYVIGSSPRETTRGFSIESEVKKIILVIAINEFG